MITIRIWTWKDYKKAFLDWCREPRQKQCSSYVKFLESTSKTVVDNKLEQAFNNGLLSDKRYETVTAMVHVGISEATNTTLKIIHDSQPKVGI